MPQNDKELLSRLHEHGVEFVVIGGVCGVLHGCPLVTFDLDICCPFSLENLRGIEAALRDLHPFHRMTPNRLPFELTDDLGARLKNLYIQTDLGKLDCLSEVAGIGNYQQALAASVVHEAPYASLRILSLDSLILAKETAARERDLVALKVLRGIREKLAKPSAPPKPEH